MVFQCTIALATKGRTRETLAFQTNDHDFPELVKKDGPLGFVGSLNGHSRERGTQNLSLAE
jgi:hypothetical protein